MRRRLLPIWSLFQTLAGTCCPPATTPQLLWQYRELKTPQQGSEPNRQAPPSLSPQPLPTVTIRGMSHFRKHVWRSPAENKGNAPKHSTYQILQLPWKWDLTHFQSRTFLHKTRYDYRATCPSSKAFLPAQNLIQWHSLLHLRWIVFHFFSLLLYHLNWNLSYILCLLCAKSLQSCPALCSPMDWSPPGSSVHGILQARILERVVVPITRGSSQPREQTHVSSISCFGR